MASNDNQPLVHRSYHGALVNQRVADGYINATAMCKAAGKEWSNYRKNDGSEAFIAALQRSLRIRRDLVVQSITTGPNEYRGTWVHPQIAIHLAQWLSADFAVQVSQWVMDWFDGKGGPRQPLQMPFHLRRYLANSGNVPVGHFSILTEMTLCFIAPMEALGYRLPERLWPDISSGLMFAKFLRDEHAISTDSLPVYLHTFEDHRRPVMAKAYPEELLHHFRRHFREVWLPLRAAAYFAERDPVALQYLPRLLPPRAA